MTKEIKLLLGKLFFSTFSNRDHLTLESDTQEVLTKLRNCVSSYENYKGTLYYKFFNELDLEDYENGSYTYLQLKGKLYEHMESRYNDWQRKIEPNTIEKVDSNNEEKTRGQDFVSWRDRIGKSPSDKQNKKGKTTEEKSQKEKLYNLLKLEKKDMAGQEDISKDWNDISEVCRIITEISRFAISDLGTDRDNDDEYISLSSDNTNENEIYGNKSFHTSSFRNWVKNKVQSIMPTYGFPQEIIDRGLNIVLKIKKDKNGKKIKFKKEDQFTADIYELGELVHFSHGVTKPTLTRLVKLDEEESVFMIISSLPTHELRMIDQEIILEGCMRYTVNNILAQFLPIQGKDTYSQPPLRLKNVFDETNKEKQREIAREILVNDRQPQTLDKIFRPDDGDTFDYVKDREKFITHNNVGYMKLDKLGVIRNNGVIRIRDMYDGRSYYIVDCVGKQTYAEAKYYSIPPTYWRYICRIFIENPKLEFKIDSEGVIIRVSEPPPSRGKRVMASTQALGKWIRRSNEFEILKTYKRGDGSSSKLEWVIDVRLWESYVKKYLQKYCLYDLEEIK
tara:strand:- start:6843 stop:8531 length:1689 start_codon:yes stop_codon:yes gene_type:complete